MVALLRQPIALPVNSCSARLHPFVVLLSGQLLLVRMSLMYAWHLRPAAALSLVTAAPCSAVCVMLMLPLGSRRI